VPPPPRSPRDEVAGVYYAAVMAAVREQYGAAQMVGRALRKVLDSTRAGEHDFVTPRQAPKCVLNASISQSRRFATQQLPTERLKAIARAANGTLNDVVLALSAGCLRRYLVELDALPDQPLIAMVPVAVRAKDDTGEGNSVGAILASLATDIDNPAERLAQIIASTKHAKQQLQGMSKAAIIQYKALLIAPSMLQMLPTTAGHVRPTFNVVISNVPGPAESLYFRGARLEALYPMSIPMHGQALNITVNSYAGSMCFGFTGCRDTLPSLQRLAVYCGDSLHELEAAL
jgi:WS/DGAT/MGAT family acyltransferase